MNNRIPEPTWARLGFKTPPNPETSGKNVGIVIIDHVNTDGEFHYLGDRLHQVSVHEDLSVSCCSFQTYQSDYHDISEHGANVLRLLAHPPFSYKNHTYVGLAPAATFFILSEYDPEKLRKGIEWLVERRQEWNIKIILNLLVPRVEIFQNTSLDPFVKAFQPALDANLLVVAANGNSRAHNNLHPIEFFAIGGYDDKGSTDKDEYEAHPSVPWGRNGDGHMRPDILAPFSNLPVKLLNNELTFFEGSCGTSSMVAGVCAYLFSKYPEIDSDTVRHTLIKTGLALKEDKIPATIIQVDSAIEALNEKMMFPGSTNSVKIRSADPDVSIKSKDPVKRALSLTQYIIEGKCSREMLWTLLYEDESPIVKKNVIWALGKSLTNSEKERLWMLFHNEKDTNGVREAIAYALFEHAEPSDLDNWIALIDEQSTDIRLSVKLYLQKFYKDSPNSLTPVSLIRKK
ncbi:S8 family serine peptidase [Lederbergia citri]|uniref:S8 family serine peptidase n=1 Tax=Lederbergia citri TaxID=2833580 RepID=A0A942YI49_9BACI|nr:S8 family serine peptidase [Lederbergia citri]MBS4196085.1 S8 family serine peptidase [Lederbergia citri]